MSQKFEIGKLYRFQKIGEHLSFLMYVYPGLRPKEYVVVKEEDNAVLLYLGEMKWPINYPGKAIPPEHFTYVSFLLGTQIITTTSQALSLLKRVVPGK